MFGTQDAVDGDRQMKRDMTGAKMVVQALKDQGVDTIFGYPGGAALPIYDEIFQQNDIRHILVRHEQGAIHAAEGYARSTGKVGVVLVTSGPGATNCVTPVRDCMADSIPIVVICGQVATGAIGTDGFQEAPVTSIMGSCAKHVFLVTEPERLEATVRTAFAIARTGRPGPVVIDVPKDVQNWTGPYRGAGELPIPGYRQRIRALETAPLSERRCEDFYALLAQSERPLIYAGGGVISSDAAQVMREFADEYGIPVVTTLMGLGAYDTTQPRALHMLGMHGTAYANYAVDDCDFLIALGARFDDRVAGVPDKFAGNAKHIAHFDIDASEIGKVKPVHWHHVGRLQPALETLLEFGRQQQVRTDFGAWHGHVAELKSTYAMNFDRNSDLIQPYAVLEAINRLFTPEFRNRLDGVIQFRPLEMEVIHTVVDKFLCQLQHQLDEKHVALDVDEDARDWLAVHGYDEKMGARPMQRLIQEKVKKPLAEEVLFGELANGGIVHVSVKDDDISIKTEARAQIEAKKEAEEEETPES